MEFCTKFTQKDKSIICFKMIEKEEQFLKNGFQYIFQRMLETTLLDQREAWNNFTPGLCKSSPGYVWQAHPKAQ